MRIKSLCGLLFIFVTVFFQCRDTDWERQKAVRKKIDLDACYINECFVTLRRTAGLLGDFTAEVYRSRDFLRDGLTKSTYDYYQGVLYKSRNDGGSAVYYSNRTEIGAAEKQKVRVTESLDLLFRPILKNYPQVVQAYLNTHDSMNRIYPFFEVLSQYAHDLDVRTFNFYYLADSSHNPARKAVWVQEPYIDPAGRGWMVSAIAPVYVNNFLEGVVGIDVTIAEVIGQLQEQAGCHEFFVNHSGRIMAIDEETANLLEVPVPEPVQYLEEIRSDTHWQDDYNLFRSKNQTVRDAFQALLQNDKLTVSLRLKKKEYFMLVAEVAELDWLLVELNAIE